MNFNINHASVFKISNFRLIGLKKAILNVKLDMNNDDRNTPIFIDSIFGGKLPSSYGISILKFAIKKYRDPIIIKMRLSGDYNFWNHIWEILDYSTFDSFNFLYEKDKLLTFDIQMTYKEYCLAFNINKTNNCFTIFANKINYLLYQKGLILNDNKDLLNYK
jgi:hypothetical protein